LPARVRGTLSPSFRGDFTKLCSFCTNDHFQKRLIWYLNWDKNNKGKQGVCLKGFIEIYFFIISGILEINVLFKLGVTKIFSMNSYMSSILSLIIYYFFQSFTYVDRVWLIIFIIEIHDPCPLCFEGSMANSKKNVLWSHVQGNL